MNLFKEFEMKIEINQLYITNHFEIEDTDPDNLVKIIGNTCSDTFEYKMGARYFSDKGLLYYKDGRVFPQISNEIHKRSILSLANSSDFEGGYGTKIRCDIDKLESYIFSSPSVIFRSSNSKFKMELGGIYVDRMGFIHFINEIGFLPLLENISNDGGDIIFLGGLTTYYQGGITRSKDERSMYDIRYQIVSYDFLKFLLKS